MPPIVELGGITVQSIDQRILELAASTDHVVTRAQLIGAGISSASIARRVGATLVPLATGLYAVGRSGRRQLLRASTMSIEGAALADLTAAELHGLPAPRSATIALVAERGEARAVPDGVGLRLTRHLPPCDITTIDGLSVTTVERTICDLGRLLPVRRVQQLIELAITDRRASRGTFSACARSFCRSGRAGSAVIRLLTAELLDETPLPASELERRGQALFTGRGLEGHLLHFVPPWSDGVVGAVDFAWEVERLIVELDGRRWHAVTTAQERDRRRDRLAVAHGWVVLRFGWQEIVERPNQVANEVRWMLRTRRPDLSVTDGNQK